MTAQKGKGENQGEGGRPGELQTAVAETRVGAPCAAPAWESRSQPAPQTCPSRRAAPRPAASSCVAAGTPPKSRCLPRSSPPSTPPLRVQRRLTAPRRHLPTIPGRPGRRSRGRSAQRQPLGLAVPPRARAGGGQGGTDDRSARAQRSRAHSGAVHGDAPGRPRGSPSSRG